MAEDNLLVRPKWRSYFVLVIVLFPVWDSICTLICSIIRCVLVCWLCFKALRIQNSCFPHNFIAFSVIILLRLVYPAIIGWYIELKWIIIWFFNKNKCKMRWIFSITNVIFVWCDMVLERVVWCMLTCCVYKCCVNLTSVKSLCLVYQQRVINTVYSCMQNIYILIKRHVICWKPMINTRVVAVFVILFCCCL